MTSETNGDRVRRISRLRVAVQDEDAAQEQLKRARISMTNAGATWEALRTPEAWQALQEASDVWSVAMARYRLARRRAEKLRVQEGETGEDEGAVDARATV